MHDSRVAVRVLFEYAMAEKNFERAFGFGHCLTTKDTKEHEGFLS